MVPVMVFLLPSRSSANSFGVIDVVPGTVEADVRCESMVPSICGDVFVMEYVCTTPICVGESQYSNTSNIDGIGPLNATCTTLGVSNSSPEDGIRSEVLLPSVCDDVVAVPVDDECGSFPDLNNILSGFLDTTHVNMSEHFKYPRASSSRDRLSNFKGVNEQVDECDTNAWQNCQPRRQPTHVPPFEYVCMGECNQVCCNCGALFWLKERLSHSSTRMGPRYHKCCLGGRVMLHAELNYPDYIKQLYKDAYFMQNMRAYNQMFSMTSYGAKTTTQLTLEEGRMSLKYLVRHFGGEDGGGLKRDIVEGIIKFLDNNNALVQLFWTTRNKYMETDIPQFHIRLYSVNTTSESIGAIVFESDPKSKIDFDIIVEQHSGPPQMEGYMADMKMIDVPGIHSGKDKRLKMNIYYAYEIHDRLSRYNLLPIGGRLFQKYIVTVHCSIEQSMIDFIRKKQNDIGNEYLAGLYDAIMRGDIDGNDVGSTTILPQYFTGGPRYMYAHYLDALAICRVHGNPSFFVTFTCNVKWPEIKLYMEAFPELTVANRLDIVDRVFERKVQDYISFFIHDQISKARPSACHSLICISEATKVQRDEDVNKYISAELLDLAQDPEGYRVVSEFMVHGPSGMINQSAPSIRDTDVYTEKQNFQLDNSYVIPYKRTLSMRYYAHINVEYCGWTMIRIQEEAHLAQPKLSPLKVARVD
ncbi:DNA helicase [Tanacetum coccineum]